MVLVLDRVVVLRHNRKWFPAEAAHVISVNLEHLRSVVFRLCNDPVRVRLGKLNLILLSLLALIILAYPTRSR
jgi:hypothetical protein